MPLLLRRRSILGTSATSRESGATRDSDTTSYTTSSSGFLTPARPVSQLRPVSENGYQSRSRLSHEVQRDDVVSDVEQAYDGRRKSKRFSLMRFRNASEPHLAAKAKSDMERTTQDLPPVPSVTAEGVMPAIVTTAPETEDKGKGIDFAEEDQEVKEKRSRRRSIFQSASRRPVTAPGEERKSFDVKRGGGGKTKSTSMRWRKGNSGLEDLHRLSAMRGSKSQTSPPSYGDESTALALPVSQPRFSESSRSDGSEGQIYGSTTTTTHTVSTHTTFFRLPRRNKNRNSLFPLPVRIAPPDEARPEDVDDDGPTTPRASMSIAPSHTPNAQNTSPDTAQRTSTALQRRHAETSPTANRKNSHASPDAALPRPSLSFAEPGTLARNSSQRSQNSSTSSPLRPPMRFGMRDRASTNSSYGRPSQDMDTPPPRTASGRNSTSTTGKSSFATLLSLSRFRPGSEPGSSRNGSPGSRSKSNSFALSREALVIPKREEGDTPGKYLERLEAAVSRSMIAGILSKSADPFAQAVLRSYTRRFPFFGEPIDMSLRKFLLEAELPKETQQVDRVIQAFADRYHECNPGIFNAPDQAYVIAFSIMMLHTDAFNKNNKRKMQKPDYIKNTSGQGLSDDILGCFYDNICYTPFVHYEEDVDIHGEKVLPFKTKKGGAKLKAAIPGTDAVGKKPSGPLDPYNLLVDQKLDQLRPPLRDSITMYDPYAYTASQTEMDVQYLQRAFTHTGILQIISARSRPVAYVRGSDGRMMTENPKDSQAGVVELKVAKVGILWRKAAKKKKTRSPWQEWGAILTGSQMYLFKNSHWAKGLVYQFMSAQRPGRSRVPVTFKPPLTDFKPDDMIKADNAVALVDSSYTRHKHAFTFARPDGQDEVFLADNESELTDWLGLINYAAAFRAAGVRIRGTLDGHEAERPSGDVMRLDSSSSAQATEPATAETNGTDPGLDIHLRRQIMAARMQIMIQKMSALEQESLEGQRQLENMLRNARHVLVLAPITQKTREEVVHAAGRADFNLKSLMRDLWRLKCYRDILEMDAKLEGMDTTQLDQLALEYAQRQTAAESESARKKEMPKLLPRLSSTGTTGTRGHAKSPPHSPLMIATARPSTAGSMERFMSGEVFRTPPESPSPMRPDGWHLPPLQDTGTREQNRSSVSSTVRSTSPNGYEYTSHVSSKSSMHRIERENSKALSDATSRSGVAVPASSMGSQYEALARTSVTPDAGGGPDSGTGLDGTTTNTTPEHSKNKAARKGLHPSMKHRHPNSSAHKHRRGKHSDSTLRSAGAEDKDPDEATPGLARDKPRFILHGKQASVIQFGGDWERMKHRREQFKRERSGSPGQADKDMAFERAERHELRRAGMASPIIQAFAREGGSSDDDDDDSTSMMSARTRSFREDAEVAATFASVGPSAALTSRSLLDSSSEGEGPASPSYDLSYWDPEANRRTTVIGPPGTRATQPHRRFSSLEKGEDGTVDLVEGEERYTSSDESGDVFAHSQNTNRRTVIGPSVLAAGVGKAADVVASSSASPAAAHGREPLDSVAGGAAEYNGTMMAPLEDEDLRRLANRI